MIMEMICRQLLIWLIRAYNRIKMKHIEINIWKACNNKCRFCMSAEVWISEKELTDFLIVKKEIEYYANNWYNSIWFLWWDISIHPRIYDIIKVAKDKNFININVITNSMLFSDMKKAAMLVESWTTRVNISIHSHLPEIEDYLTQINWWLKRKLEAIDNLNILHKKWLLKNPISINIVLNWLNYKSILETCIYFYKIKWIKDIRINFIWPRYFFSKEDENKLFLKYSDFVIYLKKLVYFSLKYHLRITFDSIPICIFKEANIKTELISRFIWENYDIIDEISNLNNNIVFKRVAERKNDLKEKSDTCKQCFYYNNCEWVWKEYLVKCWNLEFKPIIL